MIITLGVHSMIDVKARENESNMLVEHFLNVGPTCWTRLGQCVQHVGPTFRKSNDFVMTSLIVCDCVVFKSCFHLRSFRTNKCLKLWCTRLKKYPTTNSSIKSWTSPFLLAIFDSFLCLLNCFSTLRIYFVKWKKQMTKRTAYSNRHSNV